MLCFAWQDGIVVCVAHHLVLGVVSSLFILFCLMFYLAQCIFAGIDLRLFIKPTSHFKQTVPSAKRFSLYSPPLPMKSFIINDFFLFL